MDKKIEFTWLNLFQSLWMFLQDQKKSYVFWNSINFFSHSNSLIVPYVVGLIINFFTNYTKGDDLTKFYIYCIIITVSSGLTSFMRLVAKKRISGIAIHTKYLIRIIGFEKLLNFSLKWHEKENTGNKIERIDKVAEGIRKLIQLFNQKLLSFLLTFLGVLGIFAVLNIRFLIFFSLYFTVYLLIEFYYTKQLFRLSEIKNKSQGSASGVFYEGASNILSIKSSGASNTITNKILKTEEVTKSNALKTRDVKNMKTRILQIQKAIGTGVFLYLVGNGIITDLITVGFITTAFGYFKEVANNIGQFSVILSDLVEIKSSVKRGEIIFNTTEDKYFGDKKFNNKWKKISFEDVSFSYNDTKKSDIKNISLSIKKGDKIGIVGSSGSGKSTLGKLLLGLYRINSGSIKVDKLDYYKISHEEILNKISPVMQETELFNSSLLENITMLKELDKKMLDKAVEIAQLHSVIKKLPKGMNTLLGEKGYKLSGGERQRIGLARAIYKNSDILILDEATSALDSATEMKIQKGIDSLKNKTILIIAHRLSTLKNVDKILVFNKGKLVEQGKFKELTKDKKSKFFKLWNTQRNAK